MGMVKRYLEDLSVEMGYDGEITDEVLQEGERRMSAAPAPQAAAAAAGDDKSQLDKIKEAVAEFQATQKKYAKYGAYDTEPDGVFQSLMVRAFKGKKPQVPYDGDGWELYDSSMDCTTAASALHNAARKVVDLIQSCPISESAPVKKYLQGYCWRIDWGWDR